jgi:S1-C subfamily serine protease
MRRLLGFVLALGLVAQRADAFEVVVPKLAIGSAGAKDFEVTAPPPVHAEPFPQGVKLRPVSLSRLAIDMPDGAPWAQVKLGRGIVTGCRGGDIQYWEARNNANGPDAEFERVFRTELATLGLHVSGDPTNLFAADDGASDLQVGALILDMRVHECSDIPLRPDEKASGAATMQIEWQIYSASEAKVIARVRTNAGATSDEFLPHGGRQLLVSAFAENVRALAAEPAFRQIVSKAAGDAPTAGGPPIVVSLRSAAAMPLADDAKGAVTIRAADGMGSGVLISPQGYILTNHHVVGEADRVRIIWAGGRETIGQVVRSDPARDVALIKTTPTGSVPLPIRRRPVELGETVFAIGTPLDQALQNTVTRGIVSGVRLVNGHSFIQSDAAVTHGNSGGPLVDQNGAVVGLTDWGVDPSAGSSLNFFIPIGDALKALNVTPAS